MARKSKYPRGEPCECHDEPQRWVPDQRRRAGGRMTCEIKRQEYFKSWREKNLVKLKEDGKAWREKNPEKRKDWLKANPDYFKNRYLDDQRRTRNELLESCPITQNTAYSVSYGKLLNKLIKIGRLVEGGVGGEQESARQAYEGLYEKLGHELSTKPGGEAWLQRQTTSAGMPNTLRATKSPLALASSLGG